MILKNYREMEALVETNLSWMIVRSEVWIQVNHALLYIQFTLVAAEIMWSQEA